MTNDSESVGLVVEGPGVPGTIERMSEGAFSAQNTLDHGIDRGEGAKTDDAGGVDNVVFEGHEVPNGLRSRDRCQQLHGVEIHNHTGRILSERIIDHHMRHIASVRALAQKGQHRREKREWSAVFGLSRRLQNGNFAVTGNESTDIGHPVGAQKRQQFHIIVPRKSLLSPSPRRF